MISFLNRRKLKDEIEELIQKNELARAISKIKKVFQKFSNQKFIDECILCASRLSNFLSNQRMGTIDVFNSEYQKIVFQTIELKNFAFKLLDNQKANSSSEEKENTELNLILSENFENNNLYWPIINDEIFYSKIQKGRYLIEGKADNNLFCNSINLPINFNKHFKIEYSITCLSFNGNSYFGFIFGGDNVVGKRTKDIYNFNFCINPEGHYCVYNYVDDEIIKYVDWSPNDCINKNKSSNFFRLTKNDEYLYYEINDEVVFMQRFIPFYGHQLGFVAFGLTRVIVDFIKVYN